MIKVKSNIVGTVSNLSLNRLKRNNEALIELTIFKSFESDNLDFFKRSDIFASYCNDEFSMYSDYLYPLDITKDPSDETIDNIAKNTKNLIVLYSSDIDCYLLGCTGSSENENFIKDLEYARSIIENTVIVSKKSYEKTIKVLDLSNTIDYYELLEEAEARMNKDDFISTEDVSLDALSCELDDEKFRICVVNNAFKEFIRPILELQGVELEIYNLADYVELKPS